MAQRRMFSLKIIDTDSFLDMSPTAQLLYFHMSMRADDDGFVANPKKIMKMCNVPEDDLKVLFLKKYLLPFDSGVCVVKDWCVHNLIRSDRYAETEYKEEKSRLIEKDGKYELISGIPNVIPNGNQMATQVRLGKVRKGKKTIVAKATPPVNSKKTKKERYEDCTPLSCKEFVELMKQSPQRHIQIIGEWAEGENPAFNTKGQWHAFTDRNLKVAMQLIPYSTPQIEKAYHLMHKDLEKTENGKKTGFITKYSLETVLKYIDKI